MVRLEFTSEINHLSIVPQCECQQPVWGRKKRGRESRQTSDATTTHYLLLVEVSRTVCGGEGGGAGLAVPGNVAVLGGAADGKGVDAVGVAVAVTAVLLPPSVPRSPHKDGAQTTTTLEKDDHRPFHSFMPQTSTDQERTKSHSILMGIPIIGGPIKSQHTSERPGWSLSELKTAKYRMTVYDNSSL